MLRQVKGSNLGLTEPHTKVRPFIFIHAHEGHEKFSLSTSQAPGSLLPSAAVTPCAKVISSYSSQTSWILFIVWLPSLVFALFSYQRYLMFSHTPGATTFWLRAWTACQPGTNPVSKAFPCGCQEERQSSTCFLQTSRLNSLRWSHRKLQQLGEPSPSYLHLSCLILKGRQDNRLNLSGKPQHPDISKILQRQIPLLQQLFFYTHKALKSVSPY